MARNRRCSAMFILVVTMLTACGGESLQDFEYVTPTNTGQRDYWSVATVMLGLLKPDGGRGYCSATVVNAVALITAAHCVYDAPQVEVKVVYGNGQEDRVMGQGIPHPNFTGREAGGDGMYDIAIVLLQRPINAPTVALGPVSFQPGNTAQLTGFGKERECDEGMGGMVPGGLISGFGYDGGMLAGGGMGYPGMSFTGWNPYQPVDYFLPMNSFGADYFGGEIIGGDYFGDGGQIIGGGIIGGDPYGGIIAGNPYGGDPYGGMGGQIIGGMPGAAQTNPACTPQALGVGVRRSGYTQVTGQLSQHQIQFQGQDHVLGGDSGGSFYAQMKDGTIVLGAVIVATAMQGDQHVYDVGIDATPTSDTGQWAIQALAQNGVRPRVYGANF